MSILGQALRGLGAGLTSAAPMRAQEMRDAALQMRQEQMARLEQEFRLEDREANRQFQSTMLDRQQGFAREQADAERAARQAERSTESAQRQQERQMDREAAIDMFDRRRAAEAQDARIAAELAQSRMAPAGLKEEMDIAGGLMRSDDRGAQERGVALYEQALARIRQADAARAPTMPLVERSAINPPEAGLIQGVMGGAAPTASVQVQQQVIQGPPAPAGQRVRDPSGRIAVSLGGGQWRLE